MNNDPTLDGEHESIRKEVLARTPVELLGSVLTVLPLALWLVFFNAIGISIPAWLFGLVACILSYLRCGGLRVLPRSQVDDIELRRDPIRTPIRGRVNGAVVLGSAAAVYVWIPRLVVL